MEEYARMFQEKPLKPSALIDQEAEESEDDGYFIKRDQEFVDEQAILKEMIESKFVVTNENETEDDDEVRKIHQ